MNYGKGTIIFATRTKFGDTGQYDNRIGHPAMISIASDDISYETYYLLITGSTTKGRLICKEEYFDLSDCWKEVHLRKPSVINLKYIYKGHIMGDKLGGLMPSLYKKVIGRLKMYQDAHPCELYDEIKDKI